MASGSFSNNSGQNCKLVVNWNSSKGNGGSTVNASLVAQNQNSWYFDAIVYGYGLKINGNEKTGSGSRLSVSVNGASTLITHSVWVSYTNVVTISIIGYANFNGIINLSNQTVSGSATLDQVGYPPTMGSVTAPSTGVVSEKTTSITVTWNKGTSYNNSLTYAIGCSVNGGAYNWVYPNNNINTTSYTWNIGTPAQGTTYQFAVCCANNIATSGWQYSGKVTINALGAPTIGNLPSPFNPYSSTTFSIPLSGGWQSNGGSFMRRADVYMTNASGSEVKWYCGSPSYGNSSINVTVPQADIINALGSRRYSATISVIAWSENSNGTRSGYVTKSTTVNINADGGATPTLALPTISGGVLGYGATCFAAGVSTVNVSSPAASLRRNPSGTTISYSIACTGATTQNTQNAKFSNLSSGLKTITVTATDSRGLSVSVNKQVRIQPYAAPTIRNYSATRLDSPQTSAKLAYTLSYSELWSYKDGVDSKGTQLNGINSQQYSKDNTNWSTASNGGTITGLSTESIYTIYLRTADKLRTTTYTTASYKVPTILTNLALRKWGVGINGVPQTSYALDVSGNGHITKNLTVDGDINVGGKSLLNKMFPVGAIYMNMDGTNPGTFLGGTWERFGQGRTLVGEGTGNDGSTSMSFASNYEDGEYRHTLQQNEMPSHNHSPYFYASGYPTWEKYTTTKYTFMPDYYTKGFFRPGVETTIATIYSEISTNNKGGGQSHFNVQPYIVIFLWKRIA